MEQPSPTSAQETSPSTGAHVQPWMMPKNLSLINEENEEAYDKFGNTIDPSVGNFRPTMKKAFT